MNRATVPELTRQVEFRSTSAQGDGRTLEGIATPFGSPARIDSWEGTFDEQFRKGAFRKSLRERTPMMQYDHGRHPLIGSIPIGVFTSIGEDDAGLRVEGRLTDNWLITPIRDAIAEGAITGMSIRFSALREEWRDNAGKIVRPDEVENLLWAPGTRGPLQRSITEAKLLEAGPVAWPAYEQTSVGVRDQEIAERISSNQGLMRELRRALAAGLTGADALGEDMRPDVARALLAMGGRGGAAPAVRTVAAGGRTSHGQRQAMIKRIKLQQRTAVLRKIRSEHARRGW